MRQDKFMERNHENRMNWKQAVINSPVGFDYTIGYLAQAVFVNLNKFKIITF